MTKKWFLMVLFISLLAFPFMAMAQTSISYGEVVTGEITAEIPSVSYTFNGNAGELVIIRMSSTSGSGLDSFLRLLDPSGVDFYTDDDSGGGTNALLGPVTLPETGTYTIVASGCCDSTAASTTGTFELAVNLAQTPTLAVNQPVSFEMNSANPVAFFNLLNDSITTKLARLTVTLANPSAGVSLSIEVRGPIGNYYYSNYSPAGTATFTVDPIIADLAGGANLVVIRAFSDSQEAPLFADNQALQAQITVTEVTATSLASPVSGTLDDANPTAYYSFDATMGDILRLSGEQPLDSHPINVMVYGNGGFSMMGAGTADYMTGGSSGSFTIDPLRIMNTGTYYVIVTRAILDQSAEGTTSTFSLSIGATDTPMLQAGVPVTGIFDNPDVYEYTYRYQATANQTIRITLKSLNNGYGPAFDIEGAVFESSMVIASINSVAAGTITYDVLLYYDSVYIIRVRNGIFYDLGAGPGEFSLQVDVVQ